MIIEDQLDRKVDVPECPQRIVSLVPSQTELLVDLGLESQLVGVTNFCVHPPFLRSQKKRVGGTKTPNLAEIRKLNPDFIFANKEENRKEDLETLAQEFPVWISDVRNLASNIHMIRCVGELCKRQKKSELLISEINEGFRKLPVFQDSQSPSAVYLIWNEPYMTVSGDTFIGSMMRQIGLKNLFEEALERYPQISIAELKSSKPDYLLLSSEPYPFKRKQKALFEKELPHSKVLLVDGEMFSWYGSRMVYSAEYFLNLFQSEKP